MKRGSGLRPRFPLKDVEYWASRYAYADDAAVEAIGAKAARYGYYTRRQFLRVAKWKSPRTQHLCAENTEADIKRATALALSADDERQQNPGPDQPAWSRVAYGFGLPAPLGSRPVPDHRLPRPWSLGVEEAPADYTFDFWWTYVATCRSLAAEAGVPMRILDRALWQYSKEHQRRREGVPRNAGGRHREPPTSTGSGASDAATFPTETYLTLVRAAIEQRTLAYSDLPGSRRVWGRDLHRIADYEAAHRHPPLTAIVVQKATGRPGGGFREAMARVGFAREGEFEAEMWDRALRAVFRHWRS